VNPGRRLKVWGHKEASRRGGHKLEEASKALLSRLRACSYSRRQEPDRLVHEVAGLRNLGIVQPWELMPWKVKTVYDFIIRGTSLRH
jgi:hypothetical protein